MKLGPDTVYLSDITTTPPPDTLGVSPVSDGTLDAGSGGGTNGMSMAFSGLFTNHLFLIS